MLSLIPIYLTVACLECSTNNPTSFNGWEEFLTNVKLKSKVILPWGKGKPPSI